MNTQLLPSPGTDASMRSAQGPAPVRDSGRFTGQHRRRLLRSDALTVIAWSSIAASIALWLADGGLSAASSPAGAVTALGIAAGLAGMDLVLLMLLLAARIPFIDGAVGHDRALEFHRKL